MSNELSQEPAAVSNVKINVSLRAASKPGAIKAHADVTITFATSTLEIFGVSVIQQDESKPAWISYPQRAGKDSKKYFPIVRARGGLHDYIAGEVLAEFTRSQSRELHAESKNDVRQPGDDDSIPF
jgi:hypothetical protein